MSQQALRRWMPLGGLVGLCLCIGAIEPRFLSLDNLVRVAGSAAMPLVFALGATFIIIMGSIDLSIEGTMAFSGAVIVLFLAGPTGLGLDLGALAAIVGVLAAGLFGALIGWLHVRLQIPSFMASLGMGFVGIGIATLLLGGERVPIDNPVIRGLTLSRLGGVQIGVFVALAGIFFGVGAILACARLGAASALIGSGQLFAAISAVVVGGTALTGGQGGVINTLVGVLIVMVISNGVIIVGLPSYIQQGVLGLAVIVAVLLNMSGRMPSLVK